VDEALVSELESAIADNGALVVRAQKYRRGAGPEGAALLRAALALGDEARRLHRREALDAAAAGRLLADSRALTARLRALIAEIRAGGDYRAALAAYRAGDRPALARLLPEIFAGLEVTSAPDELFAALACLRRGRLRPAADVVAEVLSARVEGLAGEGDDLSPGADADLPAVTLRAEAPADESLVLRVPGAALPAPLLRLVESGEYLVHVARLPVPGAVRLASQFASEEDLRLELAPADYARWRDAVARALGAAGVPVTDR